MAHSSLPLRKASSTTAGEAHLRWTTSQEDQFELVFQSGNEVPLEYLDDLGSTDKPGNRGAMVTKQLCRETGMVVAAKTEVYQSSSKDIKSEVKILRKLVGTPQIIQIVGTYHEVYLAEYLSVVGDKKSGTQQFLEDRRLLSTFFGCLAKGLEYIHESAVRHKDVKPENILVDLERRTICHADFGISRDFSTPGESSVTFESQVRGSRMYLSPECNRRMHRSRPSDIFSLGCVFSEIWTVMKGLTLKDFYEDRNRGSSIADFCKNLDRVLTWIEHLNHLDPLIEFSEIGQVIISMLDETPSQRPSAKRVWAMFTGMIQIVARTEPYDFCGPCCTLEPAELTRLLMANPSPKSRSQGLAQEPRSYADVLVVILSWESSNPSFAEQDIAKLSEVFGPKGFNFEVTSYVIAKSTISGEHHILKRIKDILRPIVESFDSNGNLIIIYYTGCGYRDDKYGELTLCTEVNSDDYQQGKYPLRSTLRKTNLDNVLLTGAAADILEVYDTCNAGAMKLERLEDSDRRHEILASCGHSSVTPASGPLSFTDLFVESLQSHPTGIDIAYLHLAINNRILGSLRGLLETSWVRSHGGPPSPIRFVLSAENMSPIRLARQRRLL